MADKIELAVDTSVNARDVQDLGTTLDKVAAAGESMGKELEAALEEAERATRPTNSEYKRLASDLERYARTAGKSMSEAFDDFERHARDANLDVSDGTMDALRHISQQAPRDVDKVSDAFRDLADDARQSADDVKEAFTEKQLTPDDVFKADFKAEIFSNMVESGGEVIRGLKDGISGEDAGSVVDGLTDIFVQAGAVGGPLGLAAGAAGGTALQMFAGPLIAGAEEKAAAFEETFKSAFTNIVEAGTEMGRELTIAETVGRIAQDREKLNGVIETANKLGLDQGIVLRAMAGDTDAYNVVIAAQGELLAPLEEKQRAMVDANREAGGVSHQAAAAMNALNKEMSATRSVTDDVRAAYENETDALDAGTASARAKAAAENYAAEKALAHASAMAKTTGRASELELTIDGVNRKFEVMPDGKVIDVTDGNSAEMTQQKIDAISGATVTVDVQTNGLSDVERRLKAIADATFRPSVSPMIARPSIGESKP